MDTTLDGLLDRRITLEQPKDGFRVAVDTVLLAAAVPAKAGERAGDFGCGVGGAMLCLGARVPGVAVTGIEIQDELVMLARNNIARNKIPKCNLIQGDVTRLTDEEVYDHVMMNPPYHDEARHDVSSDAGKRIANTEKDGDLALWIGAAKRALKKMGTLTVIHRADRGEEILGHLGTVFGKMAILPVFPKAGTAPKRIIIRAYKDAQCGVVESPGLILHKDGGGYTDEAEAVLRHMQGL
jgi:tRNA1(Val) A37 N6-methylase TrmN6